MSDVSSTRVLVVNAGSSSLKYSLVDGESGTVEGAGLVERIGEESGSLTHRSGGDEHQEERRFGTFEEALQAALDAFDEHGPSLDRDSIAAVGHRVVHGGPGFTRATLVVDEVEAAIEELVPLAPLHNPAALAGIRATRDAFPDVPQVAVFDTAFFADLPAAAATSRPPRRTSPSMSSGRSSTGHATMFSAKIGRPPIA